MSWSVIGALLSLALRPLAFMLLIPSAGCTLFANKPNVMLSGQEQVPAVITTGFGMGNIWVGKDHRIWGSIKVLGVAANAAQIHIGAIGKLGPPVVTLSRVSSQVWEVLPNTMLSDAQYLSYSAGELYVNVHSDQHQAGEIRGQLQPRRH